MKKILQNYSNIAEEMKLKRKQDSYDKTMIKNKVMKNRRIIKVEVPKEIWDAEMSLWNMFANRDIFGAWMKSIQDVVNQMSKK